jgi:hypothetical protein
LKRIVLIVTAAAMLIAAAAAFAATSSVNTYKATYSFNPSKAGSAKKPVKTSFKQNIQVTPGTAGNRAGVLSKIVTTIYGLKVDGKDFPTCSAAKIQAASNDTGCPKGALVATGAIKALVGPSSNPATTAPGTQACNPLLHVWNAGQGKLTFFFVDGPAGTAHACFSGGITTGKVGPWKATYKQSGKNLVVTVPIPASVDYPLTGTVGSLSSEILNWKGQSSKGHTSIASVACKGNKRPFSTTLTAAPIAGGAAQTVKVPGSASCKK